MKKTLTLLLFISLTSFSQKFETVQAEKINKNSRSTASIYPVIKFDKTSHDFGTINNGVKQKTIFKYTNTGQSPLVISDIKSTCGCTVPTGWSRSPLMPNESAEFTVNFDGKGANKVTKTIMLTTNTKKGKEIVRITGFIVRP